MTPEQLNYNLALQYELSWLNSMHPEKAELIKLIDDYFEQQKKINLEWPVYSFDPTFTDS